MVSATGDVEPGGDPAAVARADGSSSGNMCLSHGISLPLGLFFDFTCILPMLVNIFCIFLL